MQLAWCKVSKGKDRKEEADAWPAEGRARKFHTDPPRTPGAKDPTYTTGTEIRELMRDAQRERMPTSGECSAVVSSPCTDKTP